jgi:hypothetical protein
VHRGRLGLPSSLAWHRADEATLAVPDRPQRRFARRVVRCGRGHHALLRLPAGRPSGRAAETRLDLRKWFGGILSSDASRPMFWTRLMHNGTYGANGNYWQVNRRNRPYGPSPHGRSWGSIPWDEAMQRPGSTQVGFGNWSCWPSTPIPTAAGLSFQPAHSLSPLSWTEANSSSSLRLRAAFPRRFAQSSMRGWAEVVRRCERRSTLSSVKPMARLTREAGRVGGCSLANGRRHGCVCLACHDNFVSHSVDCGFQANHAFG